MKRIRKHVVVGGQALVPGVTEGTLCFVLTMTPESAPTGSTRQVEPEREVQRFQKHLLDLCAELEETVSGLETEAHAGEAEILRAQILMLRDPVFQDRVHEAVRRTRFAAEIVVDQVLKETAGMLLRAGDAIVAERARDLEDLAARLQARMSGQVHHRLPESIADVDDPILAVEELIPSIVLEARDRGVKGLLVERGTNLSHSIILARAFRLPTLRVPALPFSEEHEGERVLIDADQGELLLSPTREERSHRVVPPSPGPMERDIRLPVHLSLNAIDPMQLEGVDWSGLTGVGLYRTEILFMRQPELPDEEAQLSAYRRLFEVAGDRQVTVRTLDIGGDKMLDYFWLGLQRNPYLGIRAHRLYRYHPELLVTQIRALLRSALGRRLRVLYPMIEGIESWRFVQRLVGEAVDSLRRDGLPFLERFEQGALVETPSAAWDFDRLLKQMDFASVGTNDLVQYLFAVDRGNANVAHRYRPEHPTVLRVLKSLIDRAREAGKDLSICGEIAGEPVFTELLAGLGLQTFSVDPLAMPRVRRCLRDLDMASAQDIAARCLQADDAATVRKILGLSQIGAEEKEASIGETRDPVCGMLIPASGNPHSLLHEGERVYFCSPRCKRLFQEQQERQA